MKRGGRIKSELKKRDGGLCWICGGKMSFSCLPTRGRAATIDHLLPIWYPFGYRNAKELLRLAHRGCNANRAKMKDGGVSLISKRMPDFDLQSTMDSVARREQYLCKQDANFFQNSDAQSPLGAQC